MHYLLQWCIVQIKKLMAQYNDVIADIATLREIIAYISAGGAGNFLSGFGDPEGVTIGVVLGQTYYDLTNDRLWIFTGTPGTSIGWK